MPKKVAIYTTTTCHFCHLAKEFFKKKGVKYEEYNVGIGGDAQRRQELINKSGQMGVPVIIVTDEQGKEEVIVGFDERRFRTALDL